MWVVAVLTELKNSEVNDIFLACVDGLTGFPEAITGVFPKTKVPQLVYLALKNIEKKWTMPIREWGLAASRFTMNSVTDLPSEEIAVYTEFFTDSNLCQ